MQAHLKAVAASGIAATFSVIAIGSSTMAETVLSSGFCLSSRKSTGQSFADQNCQIRQIYGTGIEAPLNAITLQWSDRYQTNIRIQNGHQGIGRTTGLFFGRATVDGADSDFIQLNDGMVCFVVIRNGNEICYR